MDNTSDVTITRVINSIDKTVMILTTHWFEDHVKLRVIRSNDVPLEGQIAKEKLVEPAETFLKTTDEYLEEMKRELAGKSDEVVFVLQKNNTNQIYTLKWHKKPWERGSIKCEPISDIKIFSTLVHGILICKSSVEESEIKYREENQNLKRKISDMDSAMVKMTSIKNKMEEALYRKFLLILNTKKELIRNLKDENKRLSNSNSVYDKTTDVSDNENEEAEDVYPRKKMKVDTLLLEPKKKIPIEKKTRPFSIFEEIADCIERENSFHPLDNMKIADLTNNNNQCNNSNDSDINLRHEESQIITEPKNHSQDIFLSQ